MLMPGLHPEPGVGPAMVTFEGSLGEPGVRSGLETTSPQHWGGRWFPHQQAPAQFSRPPFPCQGLPLIASTQKNWS